jgi:UDP-N-acetylglucosamine 2-epimerase (non-hydrolysing)
MNDKPIIITLLGIRPDIIRMFKLIKLLDEGQEEHGYKHIFCHTGQHFDHELDTLFYDELGVRRPDWNMNIGKTLKERGGPTTYAYQAALMFEKTAEMLETFKPSLVMYLGDTNTVLSSVIVARAGIPVVHIEAGGRSFDWRMPEEKCRTIIDHLSDLYYAYTIRHKENLVYEGIQESRIKVVGNNIHDAIDAFLPIAEKSKILETLSLEKNTYALVTIHREENTSTKEILEEKIDGLIRLAEEMKVILPLMPRVRNNLTTFGLLEKLEKSNVIITKPLGYFEFLKLQKEAKLIITDSGTVQEEACILGVPALICRRSTERPETIKIGASILAESNLYENAKKALLLNPEWDTMILNEEGGSPSDKIYDDFIDRLKNGYFSTSRLQENLPKTKLTQEAYGIFKN